MQCGTICIKLGGHFLEFDIACSGAVNDIHHLIRSIKPQCSRVYTRIKHSHTYIASIIVGKFLPERLDLGGLLWQQTMDRK